MGTQEVTKRFPAYDLGYLLRRLPTHTHVFQGTTGWAAYLDKDGHFYGVGSCGTPEDAATKLAIELIKQGILNQ